MSFLSWEKMLNSERREVVETGCGTDSQELSSS